MVKSKIQLFRSEVCAFVEVEQHDAAVSQAVVSGEYQLVYMSPESLLGVRQ